MSALHHRLELLPESHVDVLTKWVDVFLPDIRELVCLRPFFPELVLGKDCGIEPYLFSLCQAFTLRKVTLLNDSALLLAVKNSASIREVEMHLRGTVGATQLLQTLRSLDLKSLVVVCDNGTSGKCAFKYFLKLRGSKNTIAACCPGLHALHLSCTRHRTSHGKYIADDLLLRNLSGLRDLEAVILNGEPPDEMLPLLDGLRSVKLHDMRGKAYRSKLVRRRAVRLTGIRTNDCFAVRYRSELAGCGGLEELSTKLQRGNEISLGKAMKGMVGLRRLTLQWEPGADELWDGNVVGDGRESRLINRVEGKNVVPLIVDNAQRLEELRLRSVRLPVSDVVSILNSVGGQLRELELDADLVEKEQGPLEYLGILLEAVAIHCPGLRQLEVACDFSLLHMQLPRHSDGMAWAQLDAQTRKIDAVLEVLRRRMPMLTSNVKALLFSVDVLFCTRSRAKPNE